MGRLAIPLAPKTTDDALSELRRVAQQADLAELRLDLMDEFDLPRLLASRPCPVIVTYRPVREGGAFDGPESDRVKVLQDAVRLGAEFVDVEWDSIWRIGDRGDTKLIVSSHDFHGMPNDFVNRWRELRAMGADVVKVAGMAREASDIVPVVETLAEADVPTIAIAMGVAGLASRVLALRYPSCLLTFCSLDSGAGTAPGQVTVSEMLEVYRARELNPSTAFFGLVSPLEETERARECNAWFRERGVNSVAVTLLVPVDGDAAETIAAFHSLGARGFHVCAPHQETVGQALDQLDTSACRAGRVNTIYSRGGAMVGAWTDSRAQVFASWTEGS